MNDTIVKLELSVQQLNTVLTGLTKLTIEQGLETFDSVQKQATQQLGEPSSKGPAGPLASKVIN